MHWIFVGIMIFIGFMFTPLIIELTFLIIGTVLYILLLPFKVIGDILKNIFK